MTNPAMLAWQWREILGELGELQAHGSDPTCPCTLADSGEYCLPKHALRLNVLARETGPMAGPAHTEMLEKLAEEALDYHNKLKDRINCGKAHKDEGDVVEWARGWRKIVEPIYYACQIGLKRGQRVALHQEIKTDERWQQVILSKGPKLTVPSPNAEAACGLLISAQEYASDPVFARRLVNDAMDKLQCRVGLSGSTKPLCSPEQKAKLERCIVKVKASNTAGGCPPQGTGVKGCPVPQAVCQKSIGCRPGQKAQQKARLHASVEHAFTICQGPRGVSIGSKAQGSLENVIITPSCPTGSNPLALFHTHPHGTADLSEKDLTAMRSLGIPVCAGVPGSRQVRCASPLS